MHGSCQQSKTANGLAGKRLDHNNQRALHNFQITSIWGRNGLKHLAHISLLELPRYVGVLHAFVHFTHSNAVAVLGPASEPLQAKQYNKVSLQTLKAAYLDGYGSHYMWLPRQRVWKQHRELDCTRTLAIFKILAFLTLNGFPCVRTMVTDV